jgi:hypothetical protein
MRMLSFTLLSHIDNNCFGLFLLYSAIFADHINFSGTRFSSNSIRNLI